MGDKLALLGVITAFIVVFVVGAWVGMLVSSYDEPPPTDDSYYCLRGQVVVNPNAPFDAVIIGESMICARDWKLSGIYGPTLDDLDGPIEFRDLVEEVGDDGR